VFIAGHWRAQRTPGVQAVVLVSRWEKRGAALDRYGRAVVVRLSEATEEKEIEVADTEVLLFLVDTPGDGSNKSSSRSRICRSLHRTIGAKRRSRSSRRATGRPSPLTPPSKTRSAARRLPICFSDRRQN
jgi:hypothetical protein